MTLTASRIRNSLTALLVSVAVSGCQPWLPCGTWATLQDCRPFGALQGHSEATPAGPAAPEKRLIVCRDPQRNYYGVNADSCPKGSIRIA